MAADTIALYFVPANEGDHLIGLPARDLTEAEVDEYRQREPALMRSATTPHPGTGKALYVSAETHEDVKNLQAMTRPELNAHAADQGVENPDDYPNKDALIAAITAALNPSVIEDGNDEGEGSEGNAEPVDSEETKE